jgi:hypothetical protein
MSGIASGLMDGGQDATRPVLAVRDSAPVAGFPLWEVRGLEVS